MTDKYIPKDGDMPRKLKRVVVKEEFVALTGDIVKAIILNQCIYWSERVHDFDKFIAEEQARCQQDGTGIKIQLNNGWIYKSSDELSDETMLNLSASNIRKHLTYLIDKGWIDERTNPVHKWDRTKQYRVNLAKISEDLLKLGYVLQDYKVDIPFFKTKNAFSKIENGTCKTENQIFNIENQTLRNRKAIPEITTEITTEVDPSINQSSKEIQVSMASGWIDGGMDDITNSDKNELLANLRESTGATDEQIRLAIARTMELKAAGKVKSNLLGLLLKVVETVKTEDMLKQLANDEAGDESQQSKSRKKEFIKSLYLS